MKRSRQFRKVIISMWRRNNALTTTIISVATRAAKAEWEAKGCKFNLVYDLGKKCWVEIGGTEA